jgi:hypothetical protein
MPTKPFGSINTADKYKVSGTWQTFAYLDENLKAYITPEANGIPIKQIMLLDGWAIDANGNLTPADVASQIRNYALVCTGTPGAIGARTTAIPFADNVHTAFLFKVRLDTIFGAAERTLLLIKNESDDDLLKITLSPDDGIRFYLGEQQYAGNFGWDLTRILSSAMIGEWFDVGLALDLTAETATILFNGQISIAGVIVPADLPAATSETIELGSENISIAMVQIVGGFAPLWKASNIIAPIPRQRFPLAVNYWDCRSGDIANKLYDRAVAVSPLICDLTITNGAIEEVEMI